jgi:hypothetical protein
LGGRGRWIFWPEWSTECVPGQPGLHRETLSEKQTKPKQQQQKKDSHINRIPNQKNK